MKVLSSDRGQRLQDESHVEVSNSSVREYDEFTLCGRFMTYHFTPGTLGDYVTLYYVTRYFVTCYFETHYFVTRTLTTLLWDTGLGLTHHPSYFRATPSVSPSLLNSGSNFHDRKDSETNKEFFLFL